MPAYAKKCLRLMNDSQKKPGPKKSSVLMVSEEI
jgi:hypothetical protein